MNRSTTYICSKVSYIKFHASAKLLVLVVYILIDIVRVKNVVGIQNLVQFEFMESNVFPEVITSLFSYQYVVFETVLVGGSTRILKVQQLVKDYFNGKV